MNSLMHDIGGLPPTALVAGVLLLALAFGLAEIRHRMVANILLMVTAGGVGFMLAQVMA